MGGLFQFAFQLGEAMAASGHDVELVTGTGPELQSRTPNFRVTALLPACPPDYPVTDTRVVRKLRRAACGVRYLDAWRRVILYLERQSPDVVQWADWRFALDGWLVAWLARRHSGTVMADVAHTPRPLAEHRRRGTLHKVGHLRQGALAGAYATMDAVFVLGDRSRSELLASWPGARRIEVIPHGDESALATETVPPPERCPPRALFFGTWARHKGLDLLLDAWELVRQSVPEAELVVAGVVGGDVDYTAVANRARVIGAVDLRPGYVPVDDVGQLMGSCRLVVTPYRLANQSGVVHLAHTFGRPVVATDVGDLSEAIVDGHGGLLVPPNDASALARGIERLMIDPLEAGRMGGHAKERLQSGSTWNVVANKVLAVYEDLMAQRSPSGRPRL